jgi:hypothetical protein
MPSRRSGLHPALRPRAGEGTRVHEVSSKTSEAKGKELARHATRSLDQGASADRTQRLVGVRLTGTFLLRRRKGPRLGKALQALTPPQSDGARFLKSSRPSPGSLPPRKNHRFLCRSTPRVAPAAEPARRGVSPRPGQTAPPPPSDRRISCRPRLVRLMHCRIAWATREHRKRRTP